MGIANSVQLLASVVRCLLVLLQNLAKPQPSILVLDRIAVKILVIVEQARVLLGQGGQCTHWLLNGCVTVLNNSELLLIVVMPAF